MTSDRKSETAMKALKPIIASLTLLFAVPVCIAGTLSYRPKREPHLHT